MIKEDLHHWQDEAADTKKCDEVFEKFKAAGLLEELEYIIDKKVSDALVDESYNNSDCS